MRLSLSYTLPPPGQDYDQVREVIYAISTAFTRVDESQFIVDTPFSAALVEFLLSGAIDDDDRYVILTVVGPPRTNAQIEWSAGAQSSPLGKLECRPLIQQWRQRALLKRRLTTLLAG
jgi:hypothetical protein